MGRPHPGALLVLVAAGAAILLIHRSPSAPDAPEPPAPAASPALPPEALPGAAEEEEPEVSSTVRGRVVDETGRAVTGARVVLRDRGGWSDIAGLDAASGPDGTFEFRSGEETWTHLELGVHAEQGMRVTATAPVEVTREMPEVDVGDLALRPAVHPVVEAVDPGGQPLPGVAVTLGFPDGARSATADGIGQADFGLVLRREETGVEVTVRHPGGVGRTVRPAWSDFEAGPVRVVLDPGRPVTGRVVRPDGTPVAGARVILAEKYFDLYRPGVRPRSEGMARCAVRESRADGRFTFPVEDSGELHMIPPLVDLILRAEADGEASFWARAELGGRDGGVGDVELRPGFEPVVILRTSDGAPVAGAEVDLTLWIPGECGAFGQPEQNQYHSLCGRTDDEGLARLPLAVRDSTWRGRVVVEHPDHGKIDREVAFADLLPGPFEVVVPVGITVTGTVLAPDGTPAAGYEIRVGRRLPWCDFALEPSALVGEDGGFTVRGVPPTGGVLSIRKSVLEIAEHVDLPEAEAGSTLELGTISLPPLGEIRGRVVDDADRPVRGAYVCASLSTSLSHRGNRSATTDDEGRFTIERLPPGRYEVRAHDVAEDGEDIDSPRVWAEPGRGEVTLRLTLAGLVRFVFHDKDRPEEPLEVAPEITMDALMSRSGGSPSGSRRIRPPRGAHEYTITAPRYLPVVLSGIEARSDGEQVVHVWFERIP